MKKKLFLYLGILILINSFFSGCSSSSGSDITTDDPEKAFKIAKRKYDRKDYVDAIEDFLYLKKIFRGTEISPQVQFYLAESYFYEKEYIFAEDEYKELLKTYGDSLFPETRYKLGLSYYELSPKYSLDQNFTHKAINEFKLFLNLFPANKNVPDAEKKLIELENKLAYKNYRAGELYMKMDKYIAAANYFKTVHEDYIESEWADDAIIGHADALINAKKFDDAEKVLEKFYKYFQNSKLKSKADKLNNIIKESHPQ